MKRLFTSLLMLMTLSVATWADTYPIYVGGVQVTDDNMSNINPSGKTAGTITYSGGSLYFTGVTMSCSSDHCIKYDGESALTIKFSGTNTLTTTATNKHCIFANGPITLDGISWNAPASLTLNAQKIDSSTGYHPIYANFSGTLNIWNLYLTANASGTGAFVGKSDLSTTIYTSCSEIVASCATGNAAIRRFKSWTMSDKGILSNGDVFNTTEHRTENSTGSVASKVTLKNGLYIGKAMPRVSASVSNNYTPEGKTAGTITYYNGTLTLDGVSYSSSSRFIDNYNVDNLKIVVKGTNTINNSSNYCIRSNRPFSVEGSSGNYANDKLIIEKSFYGIYENNYFKEDDHSLTLKNLTMDLTGTRGGIGCYTSTCIIEKCKIKASCSEDSSEGAVYGMTDCTLTGCETTDGTRYDASNKAFVTSAGVKATTVNIDVPTTTYPIAVLGKQLNNLNASNFTVDGLTSGTVSYDASTKTLTLDNAVLEAPEGNNNSAIFVGGGAGDVTINFTGKTTDARLTANGDAITLYSNTTFTGTGNRVFIKSQNGSGIVTEDGIKVLVDFPGYFGSTGAEYGYYGDYPDGDVLTLKKETSDSWGYNFSGKKGSIYYLGNLVLDNMDFYHQDGTTFNTPGCYWDEADHQVEQNGGTLVTTPVGFRSIQEKLPIYIAGKQLNRVYTGTDIIEVGSPYITAGGGEAVCYDPSTKTLTLNGATIRDVEKAPGIKLDSGFDGNIVLSGNNIITIKTFNYSGIVNGADGVSTTFKGDGSLYVEGSTGLMPWGGTMTITDNVKIEAKGSSRGVGSNNTGTKGETLIVSGNAQLKASSIGALNTITLQDGQTIVEPAGASIQKLSNGYGVSVDGSNLAQNVVIQKVEKYPIYVCGDQVNSYNCTDILGDGKVKYEPSTKTLTLDGVTISDESISDAVLNEGVDGLIINISGTNDISVKDHIFQLKANTTISGTGTLKGVLSDWQSIGIFLNKNANYTVTVDGPTLYFKASRAVAGFAAPEFVMNSGELTFEPLDPEANHTNAFGNPKVTLGEGMMIVEPVGGYWSNELHGLTVDGSTRYKGKMVIKKHTVTTYELWIASSQVTSDNADDILGNGVFSYDAESKTLTIKGDYSSNLEYPIIYNGGIEDLTINVAEESTLAISTFYWIISSEKNLTITGQKLTLKGGAATAGGIITSNAFLTIKDTSIEATENIDAGINASGNTRITIDNSDIVVTTSNYGCMQGWSDIVLNNCYIDQPRPYQILNGRVCDENGDVLGTKSTPETLVIKAGTDAIQGIDAQDGQTDVYDLAGRRLNNVSRGINIVRTADGKTQKVLKK